MLNSEKYVLYHNYGYGNVVEKKTIEKLKLRSVEDLKVYVKDVINNAFVATYKKGIINFENSNQKSLIEIKIM